MIRNLFAHSELTQATNDTAPKTKLFLSGLIILLVTLVYINPLPFPWKNPAIALLGLAFWKWYMGDIKQLGLSRSHSVWSILIWGTVLTLISKFVISDLIGPLIDWLTGTTPDYSQYQSLVGNFDAVFGLWWKAMISAGFAEEIIYNGVLLVGMAQILSKASYGKHVAVIITAVLFGVAHYPQGLAGIISTGLIGLTFGYGFYLSGRNIYALILAHCLIDTYAMFMLYYGWFDTGI